MTGLVGASVVWGLGGVWVVYGGGELVVPLVEVVSGGGVSYRLLMILARLDIETFNQIKNTCIHVQYRSSLIQLINTRFIINRDYQLPLRNWDLTLNRR